jgi:hypothetical protein
MSRKMIVLTLARGHSFYDVSAFYNVQHLSSIYMIHLFCYNKGYNNYKIKPKKGMQLYTDDTSNFAIEKNTIRQY